MTGIELLSVPYDSGRRGYRMGAGPQALLRSGLVQKLRAGGHDVELVPIEAESSGDAKASAFDLCGRIARVVHAAAAGARFPVLLSGNCISTVGALAGLSARRPGVLWLDAHGDLNTPDTSTSGFLDGMAAATCLGWCHQSETARLEGFEPLAETRFVLAGARDLDPPESERLQRSGIRHLSVSSLSDTAAVAGALRDLDSIYVHLDLDVLDPSAGRANEYAAEGGVTVQQLTGLLAAAAATTQIVGLSITAYDPAHDANGAVASAAVGIIAATIDAAARRRTA